MRQSLSICWWKKKKFFVFHFQQTWYNAFTQVRNQKAPGLDYGGTDPQHRCPQEGAFFPCTHQHLWCLCHCSWSISLLFALCFKPRDYRVCFSLRTNLNILVWMFQCQKICNLLHKSFSMLHSEFINPLWAVLRPVEITSQWLYLVRAQLCDIWCY